MGVLGDLPLADLTLPGSHDTMTYDLDTRISDGGLEGRPRLSRFLNANAWLYENGWMGAPFGHAHGLHVGQHIRRMARTHYLSVAEQLE